MSNLTLQQFFKSHYLRKPHIAGGSVQTVNYYQVELSNFTRYFEHWLTETGEPLREPCLSDLSKFHIEGAMAFQLKERARSRATANKVRRAILAIWNHAASEGLIASPPKVARYREPKREPSCWSLDEFGRILAAASQLEGTVGSCPLSTWFTALLLVLYNSGLRISAAMLIQWDWLDLNERRLIVEPEFRDSNGKLHRVQKDDEGTSVILLPETVQSLLPLYIRSGRPAGVFDDWPYDRGGVQWAALNSVMKRCLVKADLRTSESVLKGDYFHKIRRVFATYVTISSSIETAREMLGHSTIQVTWRYIDKSKLPKKSQADLLPAPSPQSRVVGGAA